MKEIQARLLRSGGAQQSDCAEWLTAVTRDHIAAHPLWEFFVVLALFLPQLPFTEGAQWPINSGPVQSSVVRPRLSK